MGSQEVADVELGTASASGGPRSQVGPEVVNYSAPQAIGSQNYQKEKLQAFGAIQILNGAVILALGVLLGPIQIIFHHLGHFSLFIFCSGYPIWGPIFFIISGSLSVAAGRKPTKKLVENSFGMDIASATIALVGFVLISINFVQDNKGLMSLMLILTLLEFCITISTSIMWCKANLRKSRQAIFSFSNLVE